MPDDAFKPSGANALIDNRMLRLATRADFRVAWDIIASAIERRRLDGSDQWQNGYPNEQTVIDDIASGNAYLLTDDDVAIAYAAVIFDEEPAYEAIEGKWLTDGAYAVVHRVARAPNIASKGVTLRLFEEIEILCKARSVRSIRLDTNFDNVAMLKLLDRMEFSYCGEIFFQGASRRAYEKVLAA